MMDPEMRTYWELYHETVSIEEQLSAEEQLNVINRLKAYEASFNPGPILDIGAGLSSILLEYSKTDRELYAVDSELFQLGNLRERMALLNGLVKDHWHFLELDYPSQVLPNKIYSVIILSNFLHFFSLNQAIDIITQLKDQTDKGALIHIVVHSSKCVYNQIYGKNRDKRFQHFYKVNDLKKLFPISEFTPVSVEDIERPYSKAEKEFYVKWVEYRLNELGYADPEERRTIIAEDSINLRENYIVATYRRQ